MSLSIPDLSVPLEEDSEVTFDKVRALLEGEILQGPFRLDSSLSPAAEWMRSPPGLSTLEGILHQSAPYDGFFHSLSAQVEAMYKFLESDSLFYDEAFHVASERKKFSSCVVALEKNFTGDIDREAREQPSPGSEKRDPRALWKNAMYRTPLLAMLKVLSDLLGQIATRSPRPLRVLTQNLFALPLDVSSSMQSFRIQAVARAIGTMNPKPDVLVFQELSATWYGAPAHSEKDRIFQQERRGGNVIFKRMLRKLGYRYQVADSCTLSLFKKAAEKEFEAEAKNRHEIDPVQWRSGVCILSRLPIIEGKTKIFGNVMRQSVATKKLWLTLSVKNFQGPTAEQKLICAQTAAKGVKWARVVRDGVVWDVFGTHLDPYNSKEGAQSRKFQLNEIKKFVKDWLCAKSDNNSSKTAALANSYSGYMTHPSLAKAGLRLSAAETPPLTIEEVTCEDPNLQMSSLPGLDSALHHSPRGDLISNLEKKTKKRDYLKSVNVVLCGDLNADWWGPEQETLKRACDSLSALQNDFAQRFVPPQAWITCSCATNVLADAETVRADEFYGGKGKDPMSRFYDYVLPLGRGCESASFQRVCFTAKEKYDFLDKRNVPVVGLRQFNWTQTDLKGVTKLTDHEGCLATLHACKLPKKIFSSPLGENSPALLGEKESPRKMGLHYDWNAHILRPTDPGEKEDASDGLGGQRGSIDRRHSDITLTPRGKDKVVNQRGLEKARRSLQQTLSPQQGLADRANILDERPWWVVWIPGCASGRRRLRSPARLKRNLGVAKMFLEDEETSNLTPELETLLRATSRHERLSRCEPVPPPDSRFSE